MDIIIGKTAGFCYGVKRAVEGAMNEAMEHTEQIYCLGELVHNRQVINKLENLGIKFIEKINDSNGITIIRAHGIPKEIYNIAREKNITIRDYTCPNVLKIHEIAKNFSNDGYFVFLLGEKNHPENIATLSYCKNYFVLEDENDIEQAIKTFETMKINKLLLIAQTTYSLEKFNRIKSVLDNKIGKDINFVVKNTICKATELRQKETEELSKNVDTMIIIGGKNSSNTKKLYDIAKNNCNNSILIETAYDLKNDVDNIKTKNKVGIMAGASTPQDSIDDVVQLLKN